MLFTRKFNKNKMRAAGFEPARISSLDLESSPLDHSGMHAIIRTSNHPGLLVNLLK